MATPEEVKSKGSLPERGIGVYDKAGRVFYPGFMAAYAKNLAEDAADAVNATGGSVDRGTWGNWGASIGAVSGAASLIPATKVASVVDPLMMSGLYKDLLDRYGVTKHAGTLLEAADPLNLNRNPKFNNTSFWDRLLGWSADPEVQVDSAKALRDIARFTPAVPAWFKNDYTEQAYNDFMSKVISQNSYKNRPYFNNRVAPLKATQEFMADKPYKGWFDDFVKGLDPRTWPEAYGSFWDMVTGG